MSSVTDEIKARIDLVDLIGRSVPLRRSGSSFTGLCPFHQEKTPSFRVFPDSHTFVCFGCGKKGTAFDWVMEREHLEFGEALRTLAQMAGVELPSRQEPGVEEKLRRLRDLLARAQLYYQGFLQGSAGTAARRYLAGRGVTEETIAQFGIGYAPGGNGLLRHLSEAGFTEDEMVEAAVVSVADDGRHFDFFRERVLIPIRDIKGQTIAFGGRTLDDGAMPKYLNSRDSLLFHKQETLFALDLARKPIAQARRAVIVEGYMDAVIAHQHGHRNVVATLGTAVTERHLRLLVRVADEIVLALDSDAAGQAATWRALQVAEQGLRRGLTPVVGPNRRQRQLVADRAAQLKVLRIPSAKDPDELIRADSALWTRLVHEAQPVLDFALGELPQRYDLATAQGKAAAAEEMAELLAGIANPVEQDEYVQKVAHALRVSQDAVRQTVKRQGRPRPKAAPRHPDPEEDARAASDGRAEGAPADPLDAYALALVVRAGELQVTIPAEFTEPDLSQTEMRALLQHLRARGGGLNLEELADALPAELRPAFQGVARFSADAARLAEEDVARELTRVTLELRKRALLVRLSHVQVLMREAGSPDEREAWAPELTRLARELQAIEQRLGEPEQALLGTTGP